MFFGVDQLFLSAWLRLQLQAVPKKYLPWEQRVICAQNQRLNSHRAG
jgi:hypothetical protein